MKLKLGDKVKITAGKDRGREGKITKLFPKKNNVVVEGINKYKKHVKARGEGKPGGIIEMERPLPVANVVLVCQTCKQPSRVGYKQDGSGNKVRICRKCGVTISSSKKSKK